MSRRPTREALSVLFNPASVVIVGVSEDPIKRGRQVIRNVMNGGYAGKVYGIHRRLEEADGAPCFASLAELPGPAEVAFLAVPAEAIADTLRQCAKAGVKAAIVGAAGFAEGGDAAGLARQADLEAAMAETGIRVVGPNCNGVTNANIGLALGFNAAHSIRVPPGAIAIISHSGALFSVMVGYLDKLRAGLSLFASCGNESDLDMLDYLEHAIEDGPTRVVALLMDSVSDGARLRRLSARAHALAKHIVVLKIGTTERGAEAAVAHSSRLAGEAAAYDALFEACGIMAVASIEELMTTCALLASFGRVAGGVGMLTTSGAGAAMLADLAERHGIALPRLRAETHAQLQPYLTFSTIGNPVDLGVFERGRSAIVPAIIARDPDVGALVALINPIDPNSGVPTLMSDLAGAHRASGKPLVVIAPGGFPRAEEDRWVAQGLRFVPDTMCGLKAVAAMVSAPPPPCGQGAGVGVPKSTAPEVFPPSPNPSPRGGPASPSLLDRDALLAPCGQLTEPESLALLARLGVPVVPLRECGSADEAIAAAQMLGWPVVLKGVVEGVAHKTEAGLVRLDLRDAAALREAHRAMGAPARVIVQPFLRGRAEAIAGISHAPDTGFMLVAGLGGIFAEALQEVSMWAIPATRAAIEAKLDISALGRVLASPRWSGAKARAQLVDALLALQELALSTGERLAAVDINPIILSETGAVAVDGLVVTAQPREEGP